MHCNVIYVFGSIIVGLITVLIAFYIEQGFEDRAKYKLVIGILSARHNFECRETIRSTWLSVLNNNKDLSNKVLTVFILASENCDIPTEYRKSEYSCIEATLPESLPKTGRVNLLYDESFNSLIVKKYNAEFATVAFDFTVIFDIVVTGITIPSSIENDVLIQMWDLASDILVFETKPKKNQNDLFWCINEVPAHLLPKGFIGSVVMVCGTQPCQGVKDWYSGSKLHPSLEISPILRYSHIKNEFPSEILPMKFEDMLLPASLIIEFEDQQKMDQFIQYRSDSFRNWKQAMKENDRRLESEIEKYKDILLLHDIRGGNLVEEYKSLPRKIVSFHHWCTEQLIADFIMKTDDDSYVDIYKVYQKVLQLYKTSSDATWIGNFRRDWIVDRWGKWAEHQYTAPLYPAYACGAGNVISSDISQYISKNKDFLKFYQGEDVSMGIWLAALNVEYLQDDMWICDNACHPDMIVSTQHTTDSLELLWRNKEKCNNPCGC